MKINNSLKITEEKIKCYFYSLNNKLYVEVHPSFKEDGTYEFWIVHNSYDIKCYMFSAVCTPDQIKYILKSTIDNDKVRYLTNLFEEAKADFD